MQHVIRISSDVRRVNVNRCIGDVMNTATAETAAMNPIVVSLCLINNNEMIIVIRVHLLDFSLWLIV